MNMMCSVQDDVYEEIMVGYGEREIVFVLILCGALRLAACGGQVIVS